MGPWLYLAYTGTLVDVVPPSISVYGFADDHITHKPFSLASPLHEQQTIHELETCAVTINIWMNANKLTMNTSLTEFIMFGSNTQLKECVTYYTYRHCWRCCTPWHLY